MRAVFSGLILSLCCSISFAQTPAVRRSAITELQVMAGAYDLSNEAGTRKCIILLRVADAPGGQAAGLLTQCRISLPVLARVTAWSVDLIHDAPRARFTLREANGIPAITFGEAGPQGAAQGRDAGGQIYHLRPAQGATLAARADSLVGIRPAPAPIQIRPVPPPDPEEMRRTHGTFAFIRRGDTDTQCRITLEPYTAGTIEGRAVLAEGCADKGILYFGPKGWSASDATLWLTGTRGKLSFDRDKRGGWEKSPGQGDWLGLSRQ